MPRSARDRNRTDTNHRPRQRVDQAYHDACARLGRMGVLGLASLPGQRDGSAAQARSRPHLCPPLCLVHAGLAANTISMRPTCRRSEKTPTVMSGCPPPKAPVIRPPYRCQLAVDAIWEMPEMVGKDRRNREADFIHECHHLLEIECVLVEAPERNFGLNAEKTR
jgi:hypothetical protein